MKTLLLACVASLLSEAGETSGPAVGTGVPQFSLPDQNGVPHTLKSVLGPKGALLVFYRSADW